MIVMRFVFQFIRTGLETNLPMMAFFWKASLTRGNNFVRRVIFVDVVQDLPP